MPKREKKYKQKLLNGSELAGFIKARQLRQARSSAGRLQRRPRLAIFKTLDEPAINTYVRLKQRYGDDIEVDVDVLDVDMAELPQRITQKNHDIETDAIIVQLPLADSDKTDEILKLVDPSKDVDGLNSEATEFDSATATAILWLLAGYNVDLRGQQIVVVGQGRLVGKPVADALETAGHTVVRCDRDTTDLESQVREANILITAAGSGEIIKSDWIQPRSIVIDAGVAGEKGKVESDVEANARERDDISITPLKGGVGPLTVCALFENVLQATD